MASIIFIASLAEYNLTLVEDPSVNRLEESVALFRTILKNPWLQSTPDAVKSMILFLNKRDIFYEKIQYFHLRLGLSTPSTFLTCSFCPGTPSQSTMGTTATQSRRRNSSWTFSHQKWSADRGTNSWNVEKMCLPNSPPCKLKESEEFDASGS